MPVKKGLSGLLVLFLSLCVNETSCCWLRPDDDGEREAVVAHMDVAVVVAVVSFKDKLQSPLAVLLPLREK
jgi:hypothetical protein